MRYLLSFLMLTLGVILPPALADAQPKLELNMKKPKKFEERKLGSEKMADKKFTIVRRLFQNTYTHYNYYFNANEKLKEIIAENSEQHKDDFTELLPFYPYSLDQTSKSSYLDSILQTGTAGILLHDLRNDWIDNMYMVIGKAYLLRKDFDSAAMTFQYINTAFAPREKDGYEKTIGSNEDGKGSALSIATPEKRNLVKKALSAPPSRNESFLWLARTLVEKGDYLGASSLLNTLRNDPLFPERLKEEMAETYAYLFYKTEQWDSAAHHLGTAIKIAPGMPEKARWYYLQGQLYQMAGQNQPASQAYDLAAKAALDPVMEVYARLNMIRLRKTDEPGIIDKNIADLVAMAKKDRYSNYRDIILYAAALIEREREGYAAAEHFLQKSIEANQNNASQRSKSFYLLADGRYRQQKFGLAAMPYDSTGPQYLKRPDSTLTLLRRPGTKKIWEAEQVLQLQDSLLRLAALSEEERTAFVKQLSRKLRKEKGLKDDPTTGGGSGTAPVNAAQASADLFSTPGTNWYFYDMGQRSNGFNTFKQRWGGRPNVDNWRRSSSAGVSLVMNAKPGDAASTNPLETAANLSADTEAAYDSTDVSFDNLYSRLPLSPEKQVRANQKINDALLQKATALHIELEEYAAAIPVYEELLKRMDTGTMAQKALFGLVHCYTKTGNLSAAAAARQKLQKLQVGTLAIVNQDNDAAKEQQKEKEATQTYQQIYNLFLEGSFEQALASKKIADSLYGNHFWTPQLLYIQSIYHIRERQDSLAIKELKEISSKFNGHPLAAKAKTMAEVLGRRQQIEDYLTKLEVTRAQEDEIVVPTVGMPERKLSYAPRDSITNPVLVPKVEANAPAALANQNINVQATPDTAKPLNTGMVTIASPFKMESAKHHMVAMVLENIDPAYVNEVQYAVSNSPGKTFNGQSVSFGKKKLRDKLWLVTMQSAAFTNAQQALEYLNFIKPLNEQKTLTWLEANKYRYILISDENMAVLDKEPDIQLYEKVLKQAYPRIFE